MSFRIGVIGAGTHGTRYLRHAANDVKGMSVGGLNRRNQELGSSLAKEFHCPYHASAEGLVNDPQVDGVIICTPPSSHFELARMVIKSGKPLLIEKPMTGSLSQAQALAQLAPKSPVMVGQTLRWNPVIRKVAELWPTLGKVHHIRLAQRLEPTTLAWQKDPKETVGGSVLLTGVHIFDLARHLTGHEFTEVDSRQDAILNPVVEDIFLARARLDDGCWVSLEVSKYTQSRACWLEAVGEKGQIFADYLNGGVTLRQGTQQENFDISAKIPTLPLILEDFLALAQGQIESPVPVADGLATIAVADACYRSAKQLKPVRL